MARMKRVVHSARHTSCRAAGDAAPHRRYPAQAAAAPAPLRTWNVHGGCAAHRHHARMQRPSPSHCLWRTRGGQWAPVRLAKVAQQPQQQRPRRRARPQADARADARRRRAAPSRSLMAVRRARAHGAARRRLGEGGARARLVVWPRRRRAVRAAGAGRGAPVRRRSLPPLRRVRGGCCAGAAGRVRRRRAGGRRCQWAGRHHGGLVVERGVQQCDGALPPDAVEARLHHLLAADLACVEGVDAPRATALHLRARSAARVGC